MATNVFRRYLATITDDQHLDDIVTIYVRHHVCEVLKYLLVSALLYVYNVVRWLKKMKDEKRVKERQTEPKEVKFDQHFQLEISKKEQKMLGKETYRRNYND